MQALFTYNRHWRTLRSRELSDLLRLQWLPDGFEEKLLLASNALSVTKQGYLRRAQLLQCLFREMVTKCQQDPLYENNPVDDTFMRPHNEPGRGWNMDEWNEKHKQRNQ